MSTELATFLPAEGAVRGWRPLIIPGLLLLLFFLNGLNDAIWNSAVADEVGGHMACGYLYWRSGEYSGGVANFPLAHLLIALPVVLLGFSYELFTEQHLVLFRLPVLLMGVLLGVALYRFTSELFGRRAGLAALALFALSPNVLAHASLATLDFPITFFVFLTIYALWCYVKRPHWARMLVLSLVLAGALATKVQAGLLILLVPLVLGVSFGGRLWRRQAPVLSVWSWLLLPLVPWLFVNLIYLHVPLSAGQWLPPAFAAALERKLLHAAGRVAQLQVPYLMGTYSAGGWWYYFPFAVLVKTPLPTLALLGLGVARKPTRECLLFVALPAVAFVGLAMASSLNIGLRHVLIVCPFLFMLAGKGTERLWGHWWRRVVLLLLAAGYLWQAATIAPHHLSYFNVVAGGPRHGHKFLVDSNCDWGQNDHFLRRYVQEQGHAYAIDPGPFCPTTGPVLVNVNAFYGIYGGGGAAAYSWLKRFEPVNQIAYTWFEYDVPADAQFDRAGVSEQIRSAGLRHPYRPWNVNNSDPERFNKALRQVEHYVAGIRRRYAVVTDPRFRFALAEAFIATASYENALDEARLMLERDPGFAPALGLGGELMVCWKLGILKFDGDEYLTGCRRELVGDAEPPGDLACVVPAAQLAAITAPLSQLHRVLGTVLDEQGRGDEALEHYRAATRILSTPPIETRGQP